MRRRRCFEIAKPRRSAGGAQLNRSLGELEGPIRDPVLARFPKVAAFSSAESGSGEPPDRAQICPPVMMLKPVSTFFFSEPILGPPKVDFSRENAKKSVKKVDSTRHVATNCAKPGSGTKPRQKSGSPSLESELKLSRRPSPEAQPAPRVHSSSNESLMNGICAA